MEFKKIFRQYTFSLVVILCVAAFFVGTVSVREKTQYNMDMTPYNEIEVKEEGSVVINYNGKQYSIKNDYLRRLSEQINTTLDKDLIFNFREIFS